MLQFCWSTKFEQNFVPFRILGGAGVLVLRFRVLKRMQNRFQNVKLPQKAQFLRTTAESNGGSQSKGTQKTFQMHFFAHFSFGLPCMYRHLPHNRFSGLWPGFLLRGFLQLPILGLDASCTALMTFPWRFQVFSSRLATDTKKKWLIMRRLSRCFCQD